jgi:methylated-DNA-protein-cysteine methyltransferase-like protein
MSSRGTDAEHVSGLFRRIHAVVRRIPRGRVATYGQVAEVAGIPGGARVVGYAMRAAPAGVPWQRVVGRRSPVAGQITIKDPVGAAAQRERLEAEGVELDERSGAIDLGRFGWIGA